MRTKQHEITAPLGAATAGRLEFARGGSRVTLSFHEEAGELFRARFEGVVPMVLAHDGRVTIEYPRLSPSEWLRPNRRAAEIALNESLPWTLAFGGGVSSLRADLRRVTLSLLEIDGGASDVDVMLPAPAGIVCIRVAGGASGIRLDRPGGCAARVHIAGGASKLTFDEQRLGAIGGEIRLESAGSDQAPDRYEIDIGGGTSALTIRERGAGDER
ncbi:MAG TPA: hypothetical protein VK915_10230 [Gaiellaceae bacterium]|nr:hypothetical protein [Gaiellaceae bacterium]